MVSAVFACMNIDPARMVGVGDTVADLQMARSAEAGYVIGAVSGVGPLEHLTPLADILLDTLGTLQGSFNERGHIDLRLPETTAGITGLSSDPANQLVLRTRFRSQCKRLSLS